MIDDDNKSAPPGGIQSYISRFIDKTVAFISSDGFKKGVLLTVLCITALTLLFPAAGLYIVFYNKYMPAQVTTVPVHLQYGYGPNPFGIAPIEPPKRVYKHLSYDITVSLTLPRSPSNLNRGNFMLALHLLTPTNPSATKKTNPAQQLPYVTFSPPPPSENPSASSLAVHYQPTRIDMPTFLSKHHILYTVTRPALVPYFDPLTSLASRLFFLFYHVLFPDTSSTVRLDVPMAEHLPLSFPWPPDNPDAKAPEPTTLLLEVQAGQGLQVYQASVTFTARLRGLRWFMFRWWRTAFVLGTGLIWALEVLSLCIPFGYAWALVGDDVKGDKEEQEASKRPRISKALLPKGPSSSSGSSVSKPALPEPSGPSRGRSRKRSRGRRRGAKQEGSSSPATKSGISSPSSSVSGSRNKGKGKQKGESNSDTEEGFSKLHTPSDTDIKEEEDDKALLASLPEYRPTEGVGSGSLREEEGEEREGSDREEPIVATSSSHEATSGQARRRNVSGEAVETI